MASWEQVANESTDEEEESRRQKTAVKAAVVWKKPTKTTSQLSTERPKRDRKTPKYLGNPVMICDIEQKPEIITIPSSTEKIYGKEVPGNNLESRLYLCLNLFV